jgi:ribonuclease HII
MPWIIGIDEAGYGPNLGPFVMTSAACRVPDKLARADLWHVLGRAVRRQSSAADGRLLVEDSKIVYSPARGLHDLEIGVLAVCSKKGDSPLFDHSGGLCLARYIDWLCPAYQAVLRCEPWYAGTSTLPVLAETAELAAAAIRLEKTCRRRRVVFGLVRSIVVCPARFNQVTEQWGSKAAVLALGLGELLRANLQLGEKGQAPFFLEGDAEPAFFFVDKHGGRNCYAAALQHAIPEGLVVAQEEGMERSVYSILGLRRDIRLVFEPRADGQYLCVALASMVSKYVRELLMLEFNRFWQQHVPGLKPTAGYPGDADRFFEAIRPAMQRLHLAEPTVWRRR